MDDRVRTTGNQLSLVLGSAEPFATVRWASARAFASMLACCLLMTIGAHVRVAIPGTEVPMTLQLLAVLLIGFIFPPAHAVPGALLYVGCGTLGLPMFAPGSLGVVGPTGGYLVGFVVAVWLLGVSSGGRHAGVFRLLLSGTWAAAIVLTLGVAWQTVWFGGDVWLSVTTGLVPFLPKAVVEVLLAVAAVSVMRRRGRLGTRPGSRTG